MRAPPPRRPRCVCPRPRCAPHAHHRLRFPSCSCVAPLPATLRSSQYKGRYTLKYLIGITPCGCISFVSDGYPGSVSDDEIVRQSGLLDLLERGDAIMADRGFTDWTSMRARGLELIIPALSHAKGKGEGRERAPFTAEENERTYRIANVRIHVERMMRSRSRPAGAASTRRCPRRGWGSCLGTWSTSPRA